MIMAIEDLQSIKTRFSDAVFAVTPEVSQEQIDQAFENLDNLHQQSFQRFQYDVHQAIFNSFTTIDNSCEFVTVMQAKCEIINAIIEDKLNRILIYCYNNQGAINDKVSVVLDDVEMYLSNQLENHINNLSSPLRQFYQHLQTLKLDFNFNDLETLKLLIQHYQEDDVLNASYDNPAQLQQMQEALQYMKTGTGVDMLVQLSEVAGYAKAALPQAMNHYGLFAVKTPRTVLSEAPLVCGYNAVPTHSL